jgi:glycosyltransferase involved in cell wall biosynthesis
MRILMLGSGTISSSLSHRLVSFADGLTKAGHEVTILAPGRDKYSNMQLDNPATIGAITMRYPVTGRSRFSILNLLPYVISSAWYVLTIPSDVVYIFKPTPITITGLLARFIKRTPVIIDFDDLGSEVMRLEGQAAMMVKLVELSERIASRYATALTVASTLLERQFHKTYPSKPMIRLSNGVNSQDFKVSARNGVAHILFFGNINRVNLVAPLLKSLPQLIERVGSANVVVDIVGDGSAVPELKALAQSLAVTENVVFHGWKTLNEMKKIARSGDIGICIMPDERTTAACSNQKVFQYQAMGLCAVVNQVGDLPLYVQNGQEGKLLKSSEPAVIAAALDTLITSPQTRSKLARGGQKLAATTFGWVSLSAQLSIFLQAHIPSSHKVVQVEGGAS